MEKQIKQVGLPLVVAFSGLGDEFSFKKTLAEFEVNTLFIRDLYHHWFLGKLEGLGNGTREISDGIRREVMLLKPSKIIYVGASAGGFAALLYGSRLPADFIVAFSPQTFRTKWLSVRHFDYRWLDRLAEIYASHFIERQFLDLRKIKFDPSIKIWVYFGKFHRLDSIHARRLRYSNVTLVPLETGSHNAAEFLKLNHQLRSVLAEYIHTNS